MLLCSDTVTHCVTLQAAQADLELAAFLAWLFGVPVISGVVSQAWLVFLSVEMTHRTWFVLV